MLVGEVEGTWDSVDGRIDGINDGNSVFVGIDEGKWLSLGELDIWLGAREGESDIDCDGLFVRDGIAEVVIEGDMDDVGTTEGV